MAPKTTSSFYLECLDQTRDVGDESDFENEIGDKEETFVSFDG